MNAGAAEILGSRSGEAENHEVTFSRNAFAAVCLCCGLAGVVACLTEPPSTTYGNPNILDRANIPGEGGTEAPVCGGEGGAVTFEGGSPSFANDIFPLVATSYHCGDKPSCHGGTQAPAIDVSTAAKALASLKAISVAGQPYISADGGSLLCNLQGSCGSKMPKPPGKDPTDDELCKIQAWLAAGAPP